MGSSVIYWIKFVFDLFQIMTITANVIRFYFSLALNINKSRNLNAAKTSNQLLNYYFSSSVSISKIHSRYVE